jgi:CheY-like chemotaxis protein
MDITCGSCRTTLSIPDEKIPQGKKASFLCPKCRERVYIESGETLPREDGGGYDASQKAFDFIDASTVTALIFTPDPAKRQFLEKVLLHHGYYVIPAGDATTALTRLKYHLFDLVLVDEEAGAGNGGPARVLSFLRSLDIASRRRVILILLTPRFRTMDRMSALYESVDLVLNPRDMAEAEKIVNRTIQEHQQFYSTYNDALRKTGKG